ncbi:DUF5666 domain-containing protein [Marinobacter sp. ATCH36]|uniref:DUF5666 domain-containing protein n=1 Tax=Marinobacter sp. ATCH36 TaxID=2945106 RepID=UPI0020220AE7|nr:DUF5666 domain-containing protein [Marinobacter sp. ATCH36]MCL7943598.1 DUF5666 domain-containing protein [Marinobacter sp. ATCH36]
MNPKSIQSATRFSLSALAIGVLAACGGGGGSGDSIGVADGGIRGTGSSVGPVSGFGSVFVNGVRFETDGNVTSDDGITIEDELSEGMILRIEGEWREDDQGTADEVEYDDTLRGVIDDVSLGTSSTDELVELTVLAQTVVVTRRTVIEGMTFDQLLQGNGEETSIRVSAWRQVDGKFRASYLGVIADTAEDVELEGAIDQNSIEDGRFTINGVEINYDAAVDFEGGLSPDDLQEGVFFEVEGDFSSGVLLARQIDRDDFRRYQQGSSEGDIEFTGTIQQPFVSSGGGNQIGEFSASGLTVQVSDETEFEDGLTPSDLTEGILVQVEGQFDSAGNVVAEEIELREANAEVEGVITDGSINLMTRSFEVGGVEIRVTPLTIISDDENDDDDPRITLGDLFDGDELEIEGIERIERSNNENVFLEALRIEREEEDDNEGDGDESDGFELKGKVRDIDFNSITVLGVRMFAESNAFEDNDRSKIEELFNPLTDEFPIVEVDYEPANVGPYPYRATDIELTEDDENDDD